MPVNTILVIVLALIYSLTEGLLLLRDRKNAKGSTKIDKMSRLFNFLSTESALLSALFIMISPFNCDSKSAIFLTGIGTLLAILGFSLRHISIRILGDHFRTTVEIDENQPVIQTGPYRFVRHPSYSGIILFFIGYGVLSQNWLCLAACVLLPVASLSYRIKIEESALINELGTKYEAYKTKTKKIIPFIW